MKTVEIRINTINGIRNFVELATHYPFEVDLCSHRYTVNGKSIMGVASLDKSKPVTVVMHSEDDSLCNQFISELAPFMEKKED